MTDQLEELRKKTEELKDKPTPDEYLVKAKELCRCQCHQRSWLGDGEKNPCDCCKKLADSMKDFVVARAVSKEHYDGLCDSLRGFANEALDSVKLYRRSQSPAHGDTAVRALEYLVALTK